jgi:hypothetical protein
VESLSCVINFLACVLVDLFLLCVEIISILSFHSSLHKLRVTNSLIIQIENLNNISFNRSLLFKNFLSSFDNLKTTIHFSKLSFAICTLLWLVNMMKCQPPLVQIPFFIIMAVNFFLRPHYGKQTGFVTIIEVVNSLL